MRVPIIEGVIRRRILVSYRVDPAVIQLDSILPITLDDITPELARESGFKGVVDLPRVAKRGPGENVEKPQP